MTYDLIVVGGGPAGLSAAYAAYQKGSRSVCIIERDKCLGGILNQCIHNGFGLHYFKEELTGPEYAGRFIDMIKDTDVTVRCDTMVLNITPGREVQVISPSSGYEVLKARAIVLAMGCRERTRGAIAIPGTRPAGIFTAGTAQRYLNMEGYMVGKRVVILGSGDIGLIMARRMTLEGAKVLACVELMPYSGGLNRNIVQCLQDFNIPLYLSHTITEIKGRHRVEGVTVSEVGPDRQVIPGTEMFFDCDTVLLSVGLIPENELSQAAGIAIDPRTSGPIVSENMETSIPGIFACGNVLHVHDLVDYVTAEAAKAGTAAADYLASSDDEKTTGPEGSDKTAGEDSSDIAATDKASAVNCTDRAIKNGNLVGYTVPQHFHPEHIETALEIFFRVRAICKDSVITVTDNSGQTVASFKREHLAPGEMENIRLPKVLLNKADGDLTISIKEV